MIAEIVHGMTQAQESSHSFDSRMDNNISSNGWDLDDEASNMSAKGESMLDILLGTPSQTSIFRVWFEEKVVQVWGHSEEKDKADPASGRGQTWSHRWKMGLRRVWQELVDSMGA